MPQSCGIKNNQIFANKFVKCDSHDRVSLISFLIFSFRACLVGIILDGKSVWAREKSAEMAKWNTRNFGRFYF